jgi:hypothetical protein
MPPASPKRSFGTLPAFVARILSTLGLSLLAIAAVFALHTWFTTRSLVRATAVVSENTATQDATGVVSYTSRLRFRLPDGETIVIDDPNRSDDANDPDYVTGATVPVMFSAGHPEQARIATSWRLYHSAWIAGITGTILFDLGLVVLLMLKRRRA